MVQIALFTYNKHPLLRRINLSHFPRMKELSEVIRCLTALKYLTCLSQFEKGGAELATSLLANTDLRSHAR